MRLHELFHDASVLDIPRDQMPQVSAQDLEKSHRTKKINLPLHKLIPVQSERVPGKVSKTIQRIQQGDTEPLVVDCDRRIVNGHHRYDAYQQLGYHSVPVIQVLDADVQELCDRYSHKTSDQLAESEQLLSNINESTVKNIQQHLQSAPVHEGKFDRKPIPKTVDLLQSEKPDMENLAEITVKYIEENCQPWLQSTKKGQVVYRTISAPLSDKKPVFTRAIRTNRRPTDTPLEGHLLFNEMIKIAGGVANRSNSAFVTGDTTFGIPREGITYTVMPVGDFHYTWSPYYFDWYETFYGDEQDWKSLDLTFSKQKFKQEVDIDAEYRKHTQERGQQSHSKKQFAEDQFRWWYSDKITMGDATALDHNNIKKLIKADTGLPQAIRSGSEIMISASKMLYIDVEFYQNMVSKHILSENPR